MGRGAAAAIVLLGMCAMVDNGISGQELSRFSRNVEVNGLTFPVLDYGKARLSSCCTASLTTDTSGGIRRLRCRRPACG